MVTEREYSGASVFLEMDEKDRNFWFDFKQKKFLHNIDTFYYYNVLHRFCQVIFNF